ncbi:MAG TPA: Fic family protein, partial [Frankiaceae bacterium]|nr:Fic family protein [Frankiaceae bacterium]
MAVGAVWIGGDSYGPHGAAFVAPHHDRVADGIDDLLRFIERKDVPLFVQAALAHAQFETIHPFVDGNGRTDTSTYFEALETYREGQIEPIVERFAAAAFAAVVNGRLLVRDLDHIRTRWQRTVRARRDSAAWR